MNLGVIISAAALIVTIMAALWRDGARSGRVDKAIELLTQLTAEHDARQGLLDDRVTHLEWLHGPIGDHSATRQNSGRPHRRPGQ